MKKFWILDAQAMTTEVRSIISFEGSIGGGKSSLLDAIKREIARRGLCALAEENEPGVPVNKSRHRFHVVDEPLKSWTESRYSVALANGHAALGEGRPDRRFFYLTLLALATLIAMVNMLMSFIAGASFVAHIVAPWFCLVALILVETMPPLPASAAATRPIGILELFYSNVRKYAFLFQVKAFTSRWQLLQEQRARLRASSSARHEKHLITERSLLTDNMFLETLYRDLQVTQVERQVYQEFFDAITCDTLPLVRTIVYLPTPPRVCLDRVKQRARTGEAGIDLDYLESLEESHRTLLREFEKKPGCRVIRADACAETMSPEEIQAYAALLLAEQILPRCEELIR